MDPSQMMNRNYGMWPPGAAVAGPPPIAPAPPPDFSGDESLQFSQLRPPVYGAGRAGWKRKKPAGAAGLPAVSVGGAGGASISAYKPPALHELQHQNRIKARRFYPKKNKFAAPARFAPFAPRNTTSFLIRAKKAGGIASLVSPCPVTPAILTTPRLSPSREGLVDMAKAEWGVDGYGSMNGLIRLRSPNSAAAPAEDDEVALGGYDSSDSDVEEHLEVERRLDHDLSRFEMVYPGIHGGEDDVEFPQERDILSLAEENMTLRDRLYIMEREMSELRRRLEILEERFNIGDANDRAVDVAVPGEEASENDGGGDVSSEKSAGGGGNCDESVGIQTPMQDCMPTPMQD